MTQNLVQIVEVLAVACLFGSLLIESSRFFIIIFKQGNKISSKLEGQILHHMFNVSFFMQLLTFLILSLSGSVYLILLGLGIAIVLFMNDIVRNTSWRTRLVCPAMACVLCSSGLYYLI